MVVAEIGDDKNRLIYMDMNICKDFVYFPVRSTSILIKTQRSSSKTIRRCVVDEKRNKYKACVIYVPKHWVTLYNITAA